MKAEELYIEEIKRVSHEECKAHKAGIKCNLEETCKECFERFKKAQCR